MVTIKDIAKLAGVSHTTVSRALNDSPLIPEGTKQRIREIAASVNYTPNFNAKSLVLARSFHVGLFFSTLDKGTTSGFFHETVTGALSVIKDRYHLIVNAIDSYGGAYGSVTPQSFDGIIVMSQSHADESFIRYVWEKRIPLAVINRRAEPLPVVNVLSDDEAGVFRAVEHLIGAGHRRIAILEGKTGFQSSQNRKNGYLRAMAKHGLDVPQPYQVAGDFDLESGYIGMQQLLACDPLPTAVFCSGDELAVGAMKAARSRGLSVPGDISIAGFDDNAFSAFVSPALTTVKRPVVSMGRLAAEGLLRALAERRQTVETIRVPTELIVRESVGPAPTP
ncbi:LacI family DNA-binding transcriptional regulator [Paenibacillus koleovorans]|uniref:LacI family DNA-binding transcriptional regulator n=1 Tax=Paenibacillus koleovorans TaxID=121608 RepID=UPI000FD8B333|nr:LacI family DNA-binding transcriptional regulator [Paenibacillus koleovorans]